MFQGIHWRVYSQFIFLSMLLMKGCNLLLFLFFISPFNAVFVSVFCLILTKNCSLFRCKPWCCNFCCYAPSPRWVSTFFFQIEFEILFKLSQIFFLHSNCCCCCWYCWYCCCCCLAKGLGPRVSQGFNVSEILTVSKHHKSSFFPAKKGFHILRRRGAE